MIYRLQLRFPDGFKDIGSFTDPNGQEKAIRELHQYRKARPTAILQVVDDSNSVVYPVAPTTVSK